MQLCCLHCQCNFHAVADAQGLLQACAFGNPWPPQQAAGAPIDLGKMPQELPVTQPCLASCHRCAFCGNCCNTACDRTICPLGCCTRSVADTTPCLSSDSTTSLTTPCGSCKFINGCSAVLPVSPPATRGLPILNTNWDGIISQNATCDMVLPLSAAWVMFLDVTHHQ